MITATARPPRMLPGPDVGGAKDRLGDAGLLEHAGHEDEERHREQHVVAHQREDAADDQRQPGQAEQHDGEEHRHRAGGERQRQPGQQDDDEDRDEQEAEQLDAHRARALRARQRRGRAAGWRRPAGAAAGRRAGIANLTGQMRGFQGVPVPSPSRNEPQAQRRADPDQGADVDQEEEEGEEVEPGLGARRQPVIDDVDADVAAMGERVAAADEVGARREVDGRLVAPRWWPARRRVRTNTSQRTTSVTTKIDSASARPSQELSRSTASQKRSAARGAVGGAAGRASPAAPSPPLRDDLEVLAARPAASRRPAWRAASSSTILPRSSRASARILACSASGQVAAIDALGGELLGDAHVVDGDALDLVPRPLARRRSRAAPSGRPAASSRRPC